MEANEILKKMREDRGLTMKEVSEATKMATSLISDYETGKKAIGMKVAIRFADYYNVSLDYLMGRTTVKQMATEEPDPFASIDVSALEKRIIKKYTELDESTRALCIELFRQLSPVFDTAIQELAQHAPKPKPPIIQSQPQKPQQPVEPSEQSPLPKSDIQISKNSEMAIARSRNGNYMPAPTDEQIASFTPVPEDSGL